MRRALIFVGIIALIVAIVYWRIESRRPPPEVAHSADRRVTVWSSSAQVREPLMTLGYGERVVVLSRAGDNARIRTDQGVTGWVDQRQLMGPELWERVTALLTQARGMSVQARGHTKVVTNLRIEPGRDTQRIVQVGRGVSVDVLARRVAEVPATGDSETSDDQEPRKEDWLLVHAKVQDMGEFTGWALGRFIELDLPSPLPDYANSAAIRVVGWFTLNQAADPTGPKPQYLVIGTRGGEGQACDFTMLRAYTWGAKRKRYETAYAESNLCGKLPVRVTSATQSGGDADFRFTEIGKKGAAEAHYHMHQTIIRRVREGEGQAARLRSRR